MAHVTCPNCNITLEPAGSAAAPGICPDCCATLGRTNAFSDAPPRPARPARVPPSFDAVLAIGRDAPWAARSAFRSFAEPFGDDVSTTGALLVSEVVTNAVIHGPLAGGATVGLHFETTGNALQVEVSDEGPGFAPHRRYTGQDAGSGWGLHLVEQLSSSWGVDGDAPTRVWFELDLA